MNSKEFETYIQKITTYFEMREIEKARELCQLLLKKTKNHHHIGWVHAVLGQYKEALRELEHALKENENNASLHNHLGSVYKKTGNFDKASHHYLKALAIEDNYAEAHQNIALLYAELKNTHKALVHFQKAIHANPSNVTTHYNLGLLFLKLDEVSGAITQFKNVIQLNPNHIQAHAYLGVLYLENDELKDAELAFQNVLKLNPEHVEALSNLGVIALKREEGQLAVAYFTQALALDNDNIYVRNNLAATFMHHDSFENALTHYDILLKQNPLDLEYLYNVAVALMSLGQYEKALNHFETLLKEDENHTPTLTNIAVIYMKIEKKDKAMAYFEKALLINPDDASSLHMLYALKGEGTLANTCPEYAHNLFNNYASSYDNHMQNSLKYALPKAIIQLIEEHGFHSFDTVLDLGCGTGLVGAELQSLTKTLVGVDIAPKMVKKASDKKIYGRLMVSEAEHFLKEDPQIYDFIVAADVLPYFSTLDVLFSLIRQRLTNTGIFVFSIEITDASNWELQETARFAHNPEYIQALCTEYGFATLEIRKTYARSQNDKSVSVLLFLLQALIIS